MTSEAAPVAPVPRSFEGVPGPRGWPLLGVAPRLRREAFHTQLEGWARDFGDVFAFRIGRRRFLAVADPEVIAGVLRRRPGAFRRGSRLEQVSREMGFLGLFSANGETWRRQRPMVLHGLDPTHIRSYLPAMVEITERLRRRWQEAATQGREIDLLADLMRYTVDVTTCLAFGHNLNTLEASAENAIQQHLNVILPALFKRLLAPFRLPAWLRDKSLDHHVLALRDAVRGFIAQTREQLAARPELRKHPENLIQALLAAAEDGQQGITDEDVSGNVLTMLLAGEDTTAHTLAWLFWLLHANPQAVAQARAEVDAVLPPGGLVRSTEDLARLDAVEACANEAMRLKPVAPVIMNEVAEDAVVADVLVPRGAIVVCMMRPGGMDAKQFAQPQAFDPARWNPEAGGKSMSAAKRATMPFGAGPRMCPGRYLAMAEIKMVTAMLLANFELEEVSAPGGAEPEERLTLTMAPVGLKMRLRPRSAAS
ncbi:cytochrome P450 [Ramlibacter sp. XY19]|uniref:cytochrome P450 n=1 Tax=Ramlibacter paludis TaxID=2908000 RepID=UPI0023DB7F6E|nr:cytochrome P450 [Ramlibacter paludis]MCG2592244.1 cytochrome P450 [Ramlibacter paludis]